MRLDVLVGGSVTLLWASSVMAQAPMPSKESLEGAFPGQTQYSPHAGINPSRVF